MQCTISFFNECVEGKRFLVSCKIGVVPDESKVG